MTKFYTYAKSYGNSVLVRGYENGEYFTDRIKFKPTLYVQSQKETKFKSLDGDFLSPIKFDEISEAKDFIKKYSDVSNYKMYGNDNWHFQWINENYKGVVQYDPSLIHTETIDIETTTEHGLKPNEMIFNPLESVTIISLRNRVTKKVNTFGLFDYTPKNPDVTYTYCKTEKELFTKFLTFWTKRYPDILTSWNGDSFDIPYLYERMKRVLGETNAKKLSPFGIVTVREKDFMGEKKLIVDLVGVASLDYLQLYQKFTYEKRESYKLDFIGEVEVEQKKLENPYPTFREFYEKSPELFCAYNEVDTEIVDKLETKLKLIEVAISLSFMAKINFEDVFGPVKMWDTIIYNYLLDEKNVVVPFKEDSDSDGQKIKGAYVKHPTPGLYKKMASFDLNSLYPSIIMAINMSPETILDEMLDVTVDHLLTNDRSMVKPNIALAANGAQFKTDETGFLPELMDRYYKQRKISKNKMLVSKSDAEAILAEMKRRGIQ